MSVFLDINIILDLLLEREGFQHSAGIFRLQDEGRLQICVSSLTMVNVAYVYQKTVGKNMAVANLKYLSTLVKVLPIDGDQIQQAILLRGNDFEDTLQAVCAARGACACLITRNEKDYRIDRGLAKTLSLPAVFTPAGFLSSVS